MKYPVLHPHTHFLENGVCRMKPTVDHGLCSNTIWHRAKFRLEGGLPQAHPRKFSFLNTKKPCYNEVSPRRCLRVDPARSKEYTGMQGLGDRKPSSAPNCTLLQNLEQASCLRRSCFSHYKMGIMMLPRSLPKAVKIRSIKMMNMKVLYEW